MKTQTSPTAECNVCSRPTTSSDALTILKGIVSVLIESLVRIEKFYYKKLGIL